MQLLKPRIKKRSMQFKGGLNDPTLRLLAYRILKRAEDDESDKICNIRALEAELDALCLRQTKRYDQEWFNWAKTRSPENETSGEATKSVEDSRPKKELITRNDIFGPEHLDLRSGSAAWNDIQAMVTSPTPSCSV